MAVSLATLDDYVEAFEKARPWRAEPDLRTYLPPDGHPLYRPVLREIIRIDMEFGWESGRPRSLDDYRVSFPELFADPDSLQEVAFEDYRLRHQAGQRPSPQEYALRYGIRIDDWPDLDDVSVQVGKPISSRRADSVQKHLDAPSSWRPPGSEDDLPSLFKHLPAAERQAAAHLAESPVRFPVIGEEFLGFELTGELGRGAFGRVFLARQAALAERQVALKISPDVGAESQTLAQLQHTHIVPIYSVHHTGALQAVCMPFSGTVTLADIIRDIQADDRPRSGGDLLNQIKRKARITSLLDRPANPPYLTRSYNDAILWLGARLAEGLAHAHQRGILHRDIKPANVLLTDEGLPMLLDFNIAEDIKQRGAGAAALGGTLPYMAPEQLRAFKDGNPAVLDGRCDVYSLGIVLFELLCGRFPFAALRANTPGEVLAQLGKVLADRQIVPDPRKDNPALSPAVASIVRHCLQSDPQQRYASADALREDIDRHLADLPLKYAPDRSVPERMRKWVRRNPRLPIVGGILAAMLLVLLGAGLLWNARELDRAERARKNRSTFHDDYRLAQFYLNTQFDSADHRRQGEQICRRALALYGVPDDPRWASRWLFTSLSAEHRESLRAELGELLLLLAETREDAGDLFAALDLNRRAESYFGDEIPPIIYTQRDRLLARAKLPPEEWDWPERPPNARDQYLAARDLVRKGHFKEAHKLLALALRQKRGHYWEWFLHGYCCEGLARDGDAITSYTACTALLPNFHPAYLQRGLAHLRLRQYAEAKEDFDILIELLPERAETYYTRALALRGLGKHKEAIADLDEAQKRGFSATRVYFIRAASRQTAGDKDGSKRDTETGLQQQPTDEHDFNTRGLALLRAKKYTEGLADFDQALKLNPRSRAALMNRAHVLAEYLQRQEDSVKTLHQLLNLYPDHAPALAGQAVVLARLGQRKAAHSQIAEALARDARGEIRYQAACVYALTSKQSPADVQTALVYLRQAINDRYGLAIIDRDDDLAALRGNPAFQKLVETARLLRETPKRP